MSSYSRLPTPPLDGEQCQDDLQSFVPSTAGVKSGHGGDACPPARQYERKMGDTELSYFLPSRQSGVNDMYLHLGFHAPARLARRERVCAVWGLLRLRHPLLSARAEMHDYDDVRFVYAAPSSSDDVVRDADASLEYVTQTKDELIDSYLNGPRTLSNTRLSYLKVSQPAESSIPTPPRTPSPSQGEATGELPVSCPEDAAERVRQYELFICAMHFLGDGMALHQFANDFLGLLGSDKTDAELDTLLDDEWTFRWAHTNQETDILPRALEDNMPQSSSRFRSAASRLDFQTAQEKLVGGHSFPRRRHPARHTIVPTLSYPEDRTKAMLKKCKAHGVSISAALFAVCNVAWARMGGGPRELPVMMYSALNLRPYFARTAPSPRASYWFLAIGYFNVILPGFLPPAAQVEAAFWHRARQAKDQSTRAAKSPLVVSRTQEMARERGARARGWAREDDEKEAGTWVPPVAPAPAPAGSALERVLPARAVAPSAALIGLSLLGNLDGIYKHAAFPAVQLHTLTTGSRQRQGAMLLFGYTFKGRLWISLGYDRNGFAEGVVDRFWRETLACVDEFLG